jgi:hypothetical protein
MGSSLFSVTKNRGACMNLLTKLIALEEAHQGKPLLVQ